MRLSELLEKKNYTIYRFSKVSGIPKTTLIDLCSGKTSISNSKAITVLKLSLFLDLKMEDIMKLE